MWGEGIRYEVWRTIRGFCIIRDSGGHLLSRHLTNTVSRRCKKTRGGALALIVSLSHSSKQAGSNSASVSLTSTRFPCRRTLSPKRSKNADFT